jgi:hypothetical protein
MGATRTKLRKTRIRRVNMNAYLATSVTDGTETEK